MKEYITPTHVTGAQIKELRKKLGMTQKEFAHFANVSKPTVERWEVSTGDISGPIATLMSVIMTDLTIPKRMEIPKNDLKIRMFYMYDDFICTVIDADEVNRIVRINNYTNNLMLRAFGRNTEPSYDDYEEFLESRCFPRTRDKLKLELDRLGLPYYDPYLIIEKTEGRMADDNFWIKIDKNV